MLVGLPVSGLVYVWACRGMDLEADRARADEIERLLAEAFAAWEALEARASAAGPDA